MIKLTEGVEYIVAISSFHYYLVDGGSVAIDNGTIHIKEGIKLERKGFNRNITSRSVLIKDCPVTDRVMKFETIYLKEKYWLYDSWQDAVDALRDDLTKETTEKIESLSHVEGLSFWKGLFNSDYRLLHKKKKFLAFLEACDDSEFEDHLL